jgi:hypothetical protein
MMLDHLLTLCVLGSHAGAMRGFVRALRERRLPEPIDFTALSAIMYYDLGLVAEWVTGEVAPSRYFPSIWDLEPFARTLAFGFIASAPWFIRLGGWLLRDKSPTTARHVQVLTAPLAKVAFVTGALSVGAGLMWWAFAYLPGRAIWEARANIGLDLGLFVLVLYLPLHLLAFYIQRPESRTRLGACVVLLLTAFAIGATLPIGQRTNALLPMLLLVMFWRTPTLRAISAGAIALFVSAALLLPLFKWQFAGENSVPTSELIVATFNSDLGRTPVLTETLDRSAWLGTEVMPYPGAGYVYTALFFVPRAVLPEKGFATAIEFTAAVVNEPAALVNWRFGVGVVEELMLNFGTFAVPFGLAVVGLGFTVGSRASRRLPALRVPLCLAALWSFGYDSASLLLTFGVMAAVCVALDGLMRLLSFRPLPSTRSGVARSAISRPLVVREG